MSFGLDDRSADLSGTPVVFKYLDKNAQDGFDSHSIRLYQGNGVPIRHTCCDEGCMAELDAVKVQGHWLVQRGMVDLFPGDDEHS